MRGVDQVPRQFGYEAVAGAHRAPKVDRIMVGRLTRGVLRMLRLCLGSSQVARPQLR